MDLNKIKHANFLAFLLLTILILLAYANSFQGAWVFDDMPVIVNNPDTHMTDLGLGSMFKAAFSYDAFFRPLSSLSLGLNWYFGQDNIWGYHLVNFSIHVLTAFFLFLSMKLLLQTPRLQNIFSDKNRVFIIAFTAALLWALHPIQIQAVTYVVQRMASMASMFCIMGLYCFLRGRLGHTQKAKHRAFGLCFLCFILGLASKENAILLPCILVLTEILFFYHASLSKSVKTGIAVLAVLMVILVAAMFYLYYDNIVTSYAIRYYSPLERLLTEARVLFFYLSQIFWPLPSRFQLEHYVPLSTSLVTPLSTLWACLGIIALLLLALLKARRWPLVSYAILFYLGCHALESTIMPLDLIFEHRNYLPSMFIGLPLVYGFFRLLDYCRTRFRALTVLVGLCGIAVIVLLGVSTHIRNNVWRDADTVYLTALERYPQLSRPHLMLGFSFYNVDTPASQRMAIAHFEKALANDSFNIRNDAMLTAMALIMAYNKIGEYDNAVAAARMSMAKFGATPELRIALIEAYSGMGDWAAARDVVLAKMQDDPGFAQDRFVLIGLLEKLQDYTGVIAQYQAVAGEIKSGARTDNGLLGYVLLQMGRIYALLGDYAAAGEAFAEAYDVALPAEKIQTTWWLLGLARIKNAAAPPSEPYLSFLLNSDARSVMAAFERLMADEALPSELTDVWRQFFAEYFAGPPPELEAGPSQN